MTHCSHHGTIHSDEAAVVSQTAFPGRQFVLRLAAPQIARRASPGSFVHVQCHPGIPMRRPLSIMRASPREGWIELLYKVLGTGLAALAELGPGETLPVMGPIGRGFSPVPERPVSILVGGGVGIPPLVFLAETLANTPAGPGPEPQAPAARTVSGSTVAFFGSEVPFPFAVGAGRIPVDGVPAGATACMLALDAAGIPSRLASGAGLEGCHGGHVTELVRTYLAARTVAERTRMTVYACGPTPMLKAVQRLAHEFGLPTQLCLEEYMACAVGGCAGCVVPVNVNGQRMMKRVCVDGPVFDGATVYPA